MYSNQKDQISLEEAYNNVHNDTINEDANETLGAGVVYGAMVLAPLIVNFLKAKFGKKPEIEDFKNKLDSFLNNPTIKNDLEQQGMDYVKSNIISLLNTELNIKTPDQAEAIKYIHTILPDDNNPSLIQKAKSFFINATNKLNAQNTQQNMQDMQQKRKRDMLGLSGPNVTGFRG
jgi:hypothetical protein